MAVNIPSLQEAMTLGIDRFQHLCIFAYNMWHDFRLDSKSGVRFSPKSILEIMNGDGGSSFMYDARADGPHLEW